MLTPTEFQRAWCDEEGEMLNTFSQSSLDNVPISPASKEFLVQAGLPDSAAPFLDFGPSRDGSMPRVDQLWQIDNTFAHLWVIGSNGAGDPVCIDSSDNDTIVYLDHDNRFCRVWMNTSMTHLAEALLAYRRLVRETQMQNGDDAYLDGDIPDDLKCELAERLKNIDPSAYNAGSFWFLQLEFLNTAR